jgi:dihydroflavonol-4-reductase
VAGCGLVFHVAADYRLWARHPEEVYASNLTGTRHMLEAARHEGVERFIHTSTVGCIGFVENGLGDETTPVSLDDMAGAYKRSKFMAEQLALGFARGGFPVVIVNPTAPVGERDVKPTPTGRTIVEFLKGRMPAYLDTGLNIVDAADVAEGHWLACERGRAGERYILGSENLTLRQIFEKLAAISGRPAPRVRIPWIVAFAAGAVETGIANLTGREPRAPLDAVRMARKKMFVTHAKAQRQLGYHPAAAETALEKAVRWFQENGYV